MTVIEKVLCACWPALSVRYFPPWGVTWSLKWNGSIHSAFFASQVRRTAGSNRISWWGSFRGELDCQNR